MEEACTLLYFIARDGPSETFPGLRTWNVELRGTADQLVEADLQKWRREPRIR